MRRPRNKLSPSLVREIERTGLHNDGVGLYLRVSPAGGKFWVYRYQRNGRRRDMGLGSVATVSLQEARRKAEQCRRWIRDGLDPIEMTRALRWARALMNDDDDKPQQKLVKRAVVSSAPLCEPRACSAGSAEKLRSSGGSDSLAITMG